MPVMIKIVKVLQIYKLNITKQKIGQFSSKKTKKHSFLKKKVYLCIRFSSTQQNRNQLLLRSLAKSLYKIYAAFDKTGTKKNGTMVAW
jgi:hypothetical protein